MSTTDYLIDSLLVLLVVFQIRERELTRDQVAARMAAQASREQRLAIAGLVLDNSGSLADLDRQVGDLWAELSRLARSGSGKLSDPGNTVGG